MTRSTKMIARTGFLALGLTLFMGALDAEDASAQLSLRGGADLKPIFYANDVTSGTLGDFGYLGLHVAPGFGLAKILTLELLADLWIPIVGDGTEVEFALAPGVRLDLAIAYARANFVWLTTGKDVGFEVGAGLSFLTFMYVGLTADYFIDASQFMLGAEVGVSFGL